MIVILHPEVDNDLLESMDYYEREADASCLPKLKCRISGFV